MEHTRFTVRNFSSYTTVVLGLGLVSVGFGTLDLIMIAPKGLDQVAAVGQAEVLISAIYAVFIGVVDVFGSRLAIAEGEGLTWRRLPVLATALLLLLIPCQIIGVALGLGVEPLLRVTGQKAELIPLVGDYVQVRTYAIALVLGYMILSESLKICGLKNLSAVNLLFGFAMNALFNWVFLNTDASRLFDSPAAAVATATLVAQGLMALSGGIVLVRQLRSRPESFARPERQAVLAEFRSMTRTAPGVGLRHFNDYMGTTIPLLFIGTLGVVQLAAATVATKIYTLFCRVPQACFAGSFVFYGYALGDRSSDLTRTVRKMRLYAAVPTAVATAVTVLAAPWLVEAFASPGLDRDLAQSLLFAYLLYIPAYFFEQIFGEMLTVHQRGGLLFVSSTVVTYALTIPLAWYAVFVLDSTFLAVACKGIPTAVLALVFWRALRRRERIDKNPAESEMSLA
ncbi:MATE family efflux transporter [Streptomyces leeuwenhoekii]|uniref:Probable multidrug resistance protein NorM n=1 Tax=Streptomyces leeuwenhoekii TaxID=1437453 RepID=A0A0F7W896_STRLW|nr:MATE family efflux transporter [Streptomyces leeuwenhoekii]CQR66117.1 Integral Membrane Protein [Streptomyces leeuwenhoekii]